MDQVRINVEGSEKKKRRISTAQKIKREYRFLQKRTEEKRVQREVDAKYESLVTFLKCISEKRMEETLSSLKELFCSEDRETVELYLKFVIQEQYGIDNYKTDLIKTVFWKVIEFQGTKNQLNDEIMEIFIKHGKNETGFVLYNQIVELISKDTSFHALFNFCDEYLKKVNTESRLQKSVKKADTEFIKEMKIRKARNRAKMLEREENEFDKIFYRNEIEQMLDDDDEEEELPGGFSFDDSLDFRDERFVREDSDNYVVRGEDSLFDNLELWE